MNTEGLYLKYKECGCRVTTDSRAISGGEMFIALKGENFDGNEYALKALEAGAACAVVDEGSAAAASGDPRVIAVPDGFSAEPGKVQTLVGDLVLILSDDTVSLPEMMESALAEKFAVLGASSSAPLDSTAEAQRLLDALMASQNPEYTSSGRKILHVIPLEEMDKHF